MNRWNRLMHLVKKELLSISNGPAAYIAGLFFLLVSAVWYLNIYNFVARDYASFREYFELFPLLFVVLIPVLTMRIWAEERRSGTHELLYTMPLGDWELVMGKFLGTYMVFLVIILLTLPMVFMLSFMGEFDGGPIFSQYLGVALLGAMSISLGQWISSLSNNQISAALLSMMVLLIFTMISEALVLTSVLPAGISSILGYFSLSRHFQGFARGVIDSRDLLFFTGFSWLFLYLNRIQIPSRKWS